MRKNSLLPLFQQEYCGIFWASGLKITRTACNRESRQTASPETDRELRLDREGINPKDGDCVCVDVSRSVPHNGSSDERAIAR